jgi:hypothetical protein
MAKTAQVSLQKCPNCPASFQLGSVCPTCIPMIRPIQGSSFAPRPALTPKDEMQTFMDIVQAHETIHN